MSPWGWQPERTMGIWRYGAAWIRPFVSAAPYLTVLLLLLMLYFVSGTLTSSNGVLFDLPSSGIGDSEKTGLVALVMPMSHETMVFFDDSRYQLDDPVSCRVFGEQLAEHVARSEVKSLLVLADKRVSGGDLKNLMAIARKNGVSRVLFAEKTSERQE